MPRTLIAMGLTGILLTAIAAPAPAPAMTIAPFSKTTIGSLSDLTDAGWRRCWRDRWGRMHCRWCWRDRWGRVHCR